MVRFVLALGFAALGFVFAQGQSPPPLATPAVTSQLGPDGTPVPMPSQPSAPAFAYHGESTRGVTPDGGDAPFALHLLIGQQLGLRGQMRLFGDAERSIVGEAYYGGLFTKIRSDEALGLGARMLLHHRCWSERSHLNLGPGVNCYYQWDGSDQWTLAPSFDVSWHRSLASGAGWESGISVGVGLAVGGKKVIGSDDADQTITPIISFFTGLRF